MMYDLHVHSKYSHDSNLSPEKIIKISKKIGLSGVAITDHNTIKGGIATSRINNDKDFKVILGEEIKTEYGDVVALFLKEEITVRKFRDVIDDIKNQGGLGILAHPFRHFKFPEKIINEVDLVEGFNARSKTEDNLRAFQIAKKYNKASCAGSDAHFYFELGRGRTISNEEIEMALRTGNCEIQGKESNYYFVHGLSVSMEKIKSWVK